MRFPAPQSSTSVKPVTAENLFRVMLLAPASWPSAMVAAPLNVLFVKSTFVDATFTLARPLTYTSWLPATPTNSLLLNVWLLWPPTVSTAPPPLPPVILLYEIVAPLCAPVNRIAAILPATPLIANPLTVTLSAAIETAPVCPPITPLITVVDVAPDPINEIDLLIFTSSLNVPSGTHTV